VVDDVRIKVREISSCAKIKAHKVAEEAKKKEAANAIIIRKTGCSGRFRVFCRPVQQE
jgi:hypothetical protein